MEDRVYESRRRSLRIVLVLSIIGSGFSLFNYLVTGLALPTFKSMYESGMIQFPGEMTVYVETVLGVPRSFYLCSSLLYALSLTGVILMWKLRKSGFHLYTLSQLLILLTSALFLGREHIQIGDIMLTILFVAYYFIALRSLGAFNNSLAPTSDGNDSADSTADGSGNDSSDHDRAE